MKVLVTGAIATGKSHACRFFEHLGACRIDLDELGREVLAADKQLIGRLQDYFGADIVHLSRNGTPELDRALLAQRAFVSQDATDYLNACMMPAIHQELVGRIQAFDERRLVSDEHTTQDGCQHLVLEVSNLVADPSLLDLVDCGLRIVTDPILQLERAVARGMTRSDAAQRLERQQQGLAQLPDEVRKRIEALPSIANTGSLASFEEMLGRWWEEHVVQACAA